MGRGEAVAVMRTELRGVGDHTRSPCSCEWVRLPEGGWRFRGFLVTGDVLVNQCEWHAWYSSLLVSQQREVERQRRGGCPA